MPQILRGFGIDNAVFGRGVNKWNESVSSQDEPGARGYRSEFTWQSPDGSEVLGIFMANWYSNAMTIPTEADRVVEYVEQVKQACLRYATTSQLLFMNGCDHTPSQPDVSAAIRVANEKLQDAVLVHSNFADYLAAVQAEVGDLQVHQGEMRSEYTDGWGTLTNVLSSRIYQKQANWRCQTLLEKWVEPLSALAWKLGGTYDNDLIWYAWKILMQNHPHDSICGCSCDEVHREMDSRFEKCQVLAEQLAGEAIGSVASKVDVGVVPEGVEGLVQVIAFNPINSKRKEMAVATVEFPEDAEVEELSVYDANGELVPSYLLEDIGCVWDYKLPNVGFRVPYHARRLRVAFLADVPPTGYASYSVAPSDRRAVDMRRVSTLENEHLSVEILPDGRLNVTDRDSGVTFNGIHLLQDSLDVGDEYNYRIPEQDECISPYPSDTIVGPVWSNGLFSQCTVETQLRLRGEPMAVNYTLLLVRESRRLHVRLEIHNTHTNHRLRVLFPTGIATDFASADGQFDVVRRRIESWTGWTNPSNCQPQQAFVDVSDGEKGLTIANRGLPEYEILRHRQNTIALTLLRAVDQLGDWGVFPTPEAQCLGKHVFEYAIIPHAGALEQSDADEQARAFNVPLSVTQVEQKEGGLPPAASLIELAPAKLVLSTIKKAEDRDGLIVRFYNPYNQPQTATLKSLLDVSQTYLCNLGEERIGSLDWNAGQCQIEVALKQIVTVELV